MRPEGVRLRELRLYSIVFGNLPNFRTDRKPSENDRKTSIQNNIYLALLEPFLSLFGEDLLFTVTFLLLVLKCLKFYFFMLQSQKIKCLVLSRYPHSDPLSTKPPSICTSPHPYHMARTDPRPISLENHMKKSRMRAVRLDLTGPEKHVRPVGPQKAYLQSLWRAVRGTRRTPLSNGPECHCVVDISEVNTIKKFSECCTDFTHGSW